MGIGKLKSGTFAPNLFAKAKVKLNVETKNVKTGVSEELSLKKLGDLPKPLKFSGK